MLPYHLYMVSPCHASLNMVSSPYHLRAPVAGPLGAHDVPAVLRPLFQKPPPGRRPQERLGVAREPVGMWKMDASAGGDKVQ